MTRIAIVYFSGYGHTRKLAQAVLEGMQSVDHAEASLVTIDAEGNVPAEAWDDLANADAIVFGSPTYMGTVAWQFKKFADATSKQWFGQAWKDKLFAGFTNSATMNGDKQTTLQYLMTLAMQHSGYWVGTGLMPSNTKAAQRDDINFIGSFGGLMAQSPSDASAEEAPTRGDLDTARAFGKRVAESASLFARARAATSRPTFAPASTEPDLAEAV